MKKLTSILIVLFTFALAMTGCGTSDQPKEATSQPTQANESSPSGQTKDTFIYGKMDDAIALDPIVVEDGPSIVATTQMFERLLGYKSGSFQVEPWLAESYEASEDGLTYTFKLRQNVKFHDGTDFNADAVVFNFKRWNDPEGEYSFPGDHFIYYDAVFGPPGKRVIKDVKALDNYTVQFNLNHPMVPFIQSIAMPYFGIGSPTAIKEKKEKFKEEPVGTGPFMFKEWKRNDYLTVVKNPNYWKAGYPKLNQVIFRTIPDKSTLMTALQTGEVDFYDGYSAAEFGDIANHPEFRVVSRPQNNIEFIGFNTKKPPFNDPKVRIAFNHMVNKVALKEAFYPTREDMIPAINPMPPQLPGWNEQIQDYSYDVEKAKQLLTEAGYPNGIDQELKLYTIPLALAEDQGVKIAEALAAEFSKLGVKIKIETPELAVFLSALKKGETDMFVLTWGGDNGDPDNYLYSLFTGDYNFMSYENEKLASMLEEARSTADKEKRLQLYREAQVMIKKDAPIIPLFISGAKNIVRASLKDYEPQVLRYSDTFSSVYFE